MYKTRFAALFLAAISSISCCFASSFYVDSVRGNDAAAGTSPASAWKTLEKASNAPLKPGDRLLFRAGETFNGHLAVNVQGTPHSRIVIGRYGNGADPELAGGGIDNTVKITNCSYLTMEDLAISNLGPTREPRRMGVSLLASDGTTCHDIVLRNLHIHDVNGSLVKSAGGGAGIAWTCTGAVHSRFDGLTIRGCVLQRCDRNGIVGGGYTSRSNWYPSLHVVIRNNTLIDTGGDGIVPIACDGCLVEYNVVRDSGLHLPLREYAAGIWPWGCDNTIVQYNEVSGQHGITGDAQGFDADWDCKNTIIQYNYSHDNEGGFLLVCDDGGSAPSFNAGNVSPIIRYNLSVDDGYRPGNFSPTIHIAGPCIGTRIYNNTIIIGPKPSDSNDISFLRSNSWGGYSKDTLFQNNIIYSTGSVAYHLGKSIDTRFDNNLYFGKQIGLPSDSHALFSDPLFVGPIAVGEGRDFARAFQLRANSPAAHTGLTLPNNGGRDLIGTPLPQNGISIGALQVHR